MTHNNDTPDWLIELFNNAELNSSTTLPLTHNNPPQHQPDLIDLSQLFIQLENALKNNPLPQSNGTTRIAHSQEFMFMWDPKVPLPPKTRIPFKHKYSRNYIYLEEDRIFFFKIPATERPFHQGIFDSIPNLH